LHDFKDFVSEPDFYFARVDHEHNAGRIALVENCFAGNETPHVSLFLEHVELGHSEPRFPRMLGNG